MILRTKKSTVPILIASIIGSLFVVIVIWAVDAGVVTNPVFGPTDDDVVPRLRWNQCSWTSWGCSPSCASTAVAVGIQMPQWYDDQCYDNGGDMDIERQRLRCCTLRR